MIDRETGEVVDGLRSGDSFEMTTDFVDAIPVTIDGVLSVSGVPYQIVWVTRAKNQP